MRHFLRLFGLAIALCVSGAVFAQSAYVDIEKRLTAEQLRATGLDTLTAEQLARLNALLRDSDAKFVDDVKAQTKAEVRAEALRDQPVSVDSRADRAFIGLNDAPIRSRATGKVSGWAPGDVFQLENGQQWKVLKGKMTLSKALQSPEVVILPGIAGRWFLQVGEDMPKARVYRID
jgi:hypothetical protein